MKKILRLLLVEDSESDAALIALKLERAGYEVQRRRVEDLAGLHDALAQQRWDIIICDYMLPGIQAPDVLAEVQFTGLDIPFIVVSGDIGEEIAVAIMRAGAHDYLMKGHLARLAPVVARELAETENRRRRRASEMSKMESEKRVHEYAQTQAAILNSLSSHFALVNEAGVILAVNDSWSRHSAMNQMPGAGYAVGTNILEVYDSVTGDRAGEACAAAGGIRRVLCREASTFEMEYACEAPTGQRWFRMLVMPLNADERRDVVVKHVDITEHVEAEAVRRDRARLEQSLALAMNVQQSLLPQRDPQIHGLDVAGRSQYCDATGGDYYDFMELGAAARSGLLVAVGDVSGHGVASALVMASARAVVHAYRHLADDLAALLTKVNAVLAQDARHGLFMTMLLAAIDPVAGTMRWASGGHDLPFIYHPDTDTFEAYRETDLILGIDPTADYREYSLSGLKKGDLIFIGTDGIWEMRGANAKQFGKDRLRAFLREHHRESALDIADSLESHLARYLDGRPSQDDVTYVVIKVV